jgi:hypothetical protein
MAAGWNTHVQYPKLYIPPYLKTRIQLMTSSLALVPDGRRAESDPALLRQRRGPHDGHPFRSEPHAGYQPSPRP